MRSMYLLLFLILLTPIGAQAEGKFDLDSLFKRTSPLGTKFVYSCKNTGTVIGCWEAERCRKYEASKDYVKILYLVEKNHTQQVRISYKKIVLLDILTKLGN